MEFQSLLLGNLISVMLFKWMVSSSFLWALALIAWRWIRGLGVATDLLSLFLLKSLLVSGTIMLMGLAGFLTANGLVGLAVLGWLGIALFGREELRKAVQALLRALHVIRLAISRRPLQAALLTGVVLLLLVRMAAHVWFLPPYYIHDVNTYHLPRVAEWIQRADLTVPNFPVHRIYWPAGFELIQTWWAIFPHHDAVIEAAGVPFWAMAVGAVFVLGRCIGLGRVAAAWCSLLFAFTPGLALNATSCKNDIFIAALYLYIAALWAKPLNRRLVGRRWLLTCIAILLGMGAKPTMAFILPGLVWMGMLGLRTVDLSFFRKMRISRWAGVLLILALLLGGYWYTRNWVRFGNPFHPTSLRVADNVVTGSGKEGGQQGAFSLASVAANWKLLQEKKIYDGAMPYNPDLPDMTGWGWFVFACGSGCLLWGVLTRRRFRWVALSFLSSFFLLLGWVTPDPWNMRFAQWFPALAALGFGVTMQHHALLVPVRYVLILLAIWTTALNGLGILGNGYTKGARWGDFIRMPVSRRAPDDHDGFPPQKAFDKRIPAEELITIMGLGDDPLYFLYGPGFTRRLIYPKKRERTRGFAAFMRKHGSHYLYFPPYIQDKYNLSLLRQDVKAHRLKNTGRNVYKLIEAGYPQ